MVSSLMAISISSLIIQQFKVTTALSHTTHLSATSEIQHISTSYQGSWEVKPSQTHTLASEPSTLSPPWTDQ
jgi:hypothetical protein